MVENSPSQKPPKRERPFKTVKYLKMKVVSNLESGTITYIVKEQLESSVELTTDNSASYIKLDECLASHQAVTAGKNTIKMGTHCYQQCQEAAFGCAS